MAEFDHGVKMIAETTGRQLARVSGVACDDWRPLESTLQITTEFLADRVFLARQGRKRFVVYFEFYTTWDDDAPWDMLAKSGLLSQREKLPTVCIAVILRRRGFRSQRGQLRLQTADGPTQHLWFREVCLWRLKPEPWWENEPGLMALYPLCQHGEQPREAIIHASEMIERDVAPVGERATYLTLLSIFGKLAFPRLDVLRIIGREKMKGTTFYEDVMRYERQESILQVLRARFGPESAAEFTAALNEVTDPAVLKSLLDAAATCANVAEFRAALPTRPPRRRSR
jgi:hypothetical protein